MSRGAKLLLVALPLALLLTAAIRFIHHTDREYSLWIALYGERAKRLEARCAELKTPGVCAAARDRRSIVTELQRYHGSVMAWWWPTLVMMLMSWIAAIISLVPAARTLIHHRGEDVEPVTRGKPTD
jgi:hypothetical protein